MALLSDQLPLGDAFMASFERNKQEADKAAERPAVTVPRGPLGRLEKLLEPVTDEQEKREIAGAYFKGVLEMPLPSLRQQLDNISDEREREIVERVAREKAGAKFAELAQAEGYENSVRWLAEQKRLGEIDDDFIDVAFKVVKEKAREPIPGASLKDAVELVKGLPLVAGDLIKGGVGIAKYLPKAIVEGFKAKPGDATPAMDLMGASVLQGTGESLRLAQRLGRALFSDMSDYSEENLKKRLKGDLKFYDFMRAVESGEAFPDLTPEEAEYIESIGEFTELSNFVPFGVGLNAAKKLKPAVAAVRVQTKAAQAAKEAAEAAASVGTVRQAAGDVVEGVGKGLEKAAGSPTVRAATAGTAAALSGASPPVILGAALGATTDAAGEFAKKGPRALQRTGQAIKKPLKPGSPTARLAEIMKETGTGAFYGTLGMVPFASIAETPEERGTLLAGGTVFGAAGAGVGQVKNSIDAFGQSLWTPEPSNPNAPREAATNYGNPLDAQHSKFVAALPNDTANKVEALRRLIGPENELFVLSPLEYDAITGTPSQGVTVTKTDGGQRVLIRGGAESLFHEVGHVIFKSLPAAEQQSLKDAVIKAYSTQDLKAMQSLYEKSGIELGSLDSLIEEVLAENFQVALNGGPLGKLGVPQGVAASIYSTFGRFAERAGMREVRPGGPVQTSETLQFTPSYIVQKAIQNAVEAMNLDGYKATPAASSVQPGAPVPSPAPAQAPAASAGVTNVEPVIPPAQPKGFKKGDPLGVIKDPQGNLIFSGAKVWADVGGFNVRIEGVDADGNLVRADVPRQWLESPAGVPDPGVDVGASVPVPTALTQTETPAPAPAPQTRPNVRVTPQQQAEFTQPSPEQVETNRAKLEALAGRPRNEQPFVETEYFSARADEFAPDASIRREQRRLADAAEANTPDYENPLRAPYQKIFAPFKYIPGENPRVFGFSYDKLIQNLDVMAGWLSEHPDVQIPYSSAADPQIRSDIATYLRNQSNGYGGGGEKLARPADTKPGSVTPENPDYTPVTLPREKVEFIATLMGLAVPQKATPANLYFKRFAEMNGLIPKETASGSFDPNSFRQRLVAAGFNPAVLNGVVENLPIRRISGEVIERPDIELTAGDTAFTQAAFMPEENVEGFKRRLDRSISDKVANAKRSDYGEGDVLFTPTGTPVTFVSDLTEGRDGRRRALVELDDGSRTSMATDDLSPETPSRESALAYLASKYPTYEAFVEAANRRGYDESDGLADVWTSRDAAFMPAPRKQGENYEVLPKGVDPFKSRSTGRFWLTPDNQWVWTEDHASAAKEILGKEFIPEKYNDAAPIQQLEKRGWVRVVEEGGDASTFDLRDPIYVSSNLSSTQRRLLEDYAIESRRALVHDKVVNGRPKSFVLFDPDAPAFMPAEGVSPGTGLSFKKFFSDVTKGTFGKSDKPFVPEINLSDDLRKVVEVKNSHSGNFDDHISKSIPTFYEAQIATARALSELPAGSKVLDIAASEGSWGKAITELSNGEVSTVSLDPNEDMAHFFKTKSAVPGADYSTDAFLNGFTDGGVEVKAHDPTDRFDAIHESMGFQFIDPNRAAQVAEVKRLLKPDGIFLTEEKLKNDNWAANERLKDSEHKNKYFSAAELADKEKAVGFQQSKAEQKSVGMVDNMVSAEAYENVLLDNFKHVFQYWDSGNFKGYVASDSLAAVSDFLEGLPPLKSKFSTIETPLQVKRSSMFVNVGLNVPGGGQLTPERVVETLEAKGVQVKNYSVETSSTEPTVAATISPTDIATLDKVARSLGQEAVAAYDPKTKKGFLAGPNAEKWSPFNPDEFLYPQDQKPRYMPEAPESMEEAGSRVFESVGRGAFMPAPPKEGVTEWVASAAIKIPDGEILTGLSHPLIIEEHPALIEGSQDVIDGFVSNLGNFYTREAAMKLAIDAGQITPERYEAAISDYEAESSDANLSRNELETYTFDDAKAFMPLSEAELGKEQFSTTKKKGSLGGPQHLVHFSSVAARTLNPKKMSGKGAATPTDLQGIPRAYFYRIGDSVYETGIADRPYILGALVDGNAIYDLNSDPLGYRSMANREKADRMLVRAGFAGMRGKAGPIDMVAMFKPVRVSPLTKDDVYTPKQLRAQERKRGLLEEEEIDYQAEDAAWEKEREKRWGDEARFMPSSRSYSLIAPDGKVTPVIGGSHGAAAQMLLYNDSKTNAEALDRAFNDGYVRVANMGQDLYADTRGNRLTPKQLRELKNIAIEDDKARIVLDSGDDYRVIWTSNDNAAFMPAEQHLPGLYSQLQKTLEAIPPKASRQQIEAALRDGVKEKGVLVERPVKKEELEDVKDQNGVSFAAWLQSNPEATRQDMLDFVEAGRVQVLEVDSPEDRYSQYVIDGGENYREVVFTTPDTTPRFTIEDLTETVSYVPSARERELFWLIDGPDNSYQILKKYHPTLEDAKAYVVRTKQPASKGYRSTHFREIPNYLAHARVNERTGPDGAEVLFVEEIQSDLHQEGRKKGYRGGVTDTAGWTASKVVYGRAGLRPQTEWKVLNAEGEVSGNVPEALARNADEAIAKAAQWRKESRTIPDAPFKKSWPELVFKKLLNEAALTGKNFLAWTTGEQQAARYDLSKQIDTLVVNKQAPDEYGVQAFKGDNRVISEPSVSADGLSSLVGKELAGKAVDQINEKERLGRRALNARFEGVDLRVGGEGMKGFYDKILPSFADKYAKKWGVKTQDLALQSAAVAEKIETGEWVINRPDGTAVTVGAGYGQTSEQVLKRWYEGKVPSVKVHALPITEAMRKDILENGQPLYMPSAESAAPLADESVRTPRRPLAEDDRPVDEKEFTPEMAAAFMPAAPKVDLEDYVGRDVITITTDRLGIGDKEVGPKGAKRTLDRKAQGGRGFPHLYTGLGWAFSSPEAASSFLTRLRAASEGDRALVATAVLGETNVLNSPFGQYAVAAAYRQAVESGALRLKDVDKSIRTIFERAAKSAQGNPDLAKIKSLADYERMAAKWPFTFGVTKEVVKRLDAAELKIPADVRRAFGLDALSLARDISDPELAGLPNFTLVSLMEIPVDQKAVKDDIHTSYPYSVQGRLLGFLRDPLRAEALITTPRVRQKSGQIMAKPMMMVMPSIDALTPSEVNPDPAQRLRDARLEYAR